MKTLKDILGETPLETFLNKYFSRLPFSVPSGAQNYLHLLDWSRVREVLETGKSITRIVQDGKVLRDYVKVDLEEAKRHFQSGHTLLLRYAEKSSPALLKVAQDFSQSFHTDVDIQLYCTPAGHNAFGWHYDVEEVFIIQTHGCKEYTIRPNTVHPHPLVESIPKDLEFEKETSGLEIKVRLEAGDVLYIPSGWWHIARTQAESMHVSIGLMPTSAIELVKFLPTFLVRQEFWRRRMPLHLTFEDEALEVAYYSEALTTLGREIQKQMSAPEFLKAFLEFKKQGPKFERQDQ